MQLSQKEEVLESCTQCDQSTFPGGTWAPGLTAHHSTPHLGLLHGQTEISI